MSWHPECNIQIATKNGDNTQISKPFRIRLWLGIEKPFIDSNIWWNFPQFRVQQKRKPKTLTVIGCRINWITAANNFSMADSRIKDIYICTLPKMGRLWCLQKREQNILSAIDISFFYKHIHINSIPELDWQAVDVCCLFYFFQFLSFIATWIIEIWWIFFAERESFEIHCWLSDRSYMQNNE